MENYNSYFRLKETNIDDAKVHCDNMYLSQDLYAGRGEKKFYVLPFNKDIMYESLMKKDNHLYEIIPENTHVKPYFDLEIEGEDVHIDSIDKVDTFVHWVIPIFNVLFNVEIRKNDFIYMNSTRDNKLSYHLVVHGYMFKNNACQKLFVKYVKSVFDKLSPSDPVKSSLTWMYKDSEERAIFDCIPYNKNQNIRLCNQSKKGKPYVLKKLDKAIPNKMTLTRVLPDDEFELLDVDNCKAIHSVQNVKSRSTAVKTSTKTKVVKKKVVKPDTEEEEVEVDDNADIMQYTLFHRLKMNIAHVHKEPLYYQYLCIIPNYNINWEVYRNVGFALKGCDADITIFKQWCKLSNKYNPNDAIFADYNKFRCKKDVCHYDEKFLCNLAKETNLELYKQIFDSTNDRINEYLTCNYSEFIRINETSKYICAEDNGDFKFYEELETADVNVLHSHMGKGKTTYIKNKLHYLELAHGYTSVLFISSRQSFANFICGSFHGVQNYMDLKKKGTLVANKLVCSLESLFKIDADQKYDIVIVDECESVLKQFSSSTLKDVELTFAIFKEFITAAKKSVFCDAFVTNRSLDFIRSVCKDKTKCVLTNFAHNERRKATQIEVADFNDDIVKLHQNKKKVYACYSSKKCLDELQQKMVSSNADMSDVIMYNKNSNKETNMSLKNVNTTWSDKNVVATTAKITVGVSYDSAFDYTYINASCNIGPTVRDIMQMIMRVRHLTTNEMKFCLPLRKYHTMEKDLIYQRFHDFNERDDIKIDIILALLKKSGQGKGIFLYDQVEGLKSKVDADLKRILFSNVRETLISQMYFSELFIIMLKKIGCKVVEKEVEKKKEKKDKEEIDFIEAFDEIEDIGYEEYQQLLEDIQTDRSAEKQMIIDKYRYNRLWEESTPAMLKAKLFTKYSDAYKQKTFYNVILEKKNSIDVAVDLHHELIDSNYSILDMECNVIKKDYIKKLNKKLKLNHSQDIKTIDKSSMEACIKFVKDNIKEFNALYNSNVKMNGTSQDYINALRLLKKIYTQWSGMALKVETKDSVTKNAKTYILDGEPFYDHVKKLIAAEEIVYNIMTEDD